MSEHPDIETLIERWPSLSDFARDAGVSYGAAKQMRRRGSIPVIYWPALLASQVGRREGLTADKLVTLHAPAPAEATP